MREHLLCPSTEGCHVLARPWSEPLADFAVEEFLALHGLFTRDARDGGEIDDDASSPLGNSEETETARARMRHSTGPSPVKRPMSEAVASRIGSRLVAGTLHEILCEGRDRETLRRAIVALEKAEREKTDDEFYSRRPHALLMRFPGATTANGGGPLVALGAKARKKWLRSCVAGTWLDPANDDETDGCGSREKSRERARFSRFTEIRRTTGTKRDAACVAWVETRRAFCLTRPVAAEAALRYVRACTPKTSKKTSDDDERGTRNEEHRAAPADPAARRRRRQPRADRVSQPDVRPVRGHRRSISPGDRAGRAVRARRGRARDVVEHDVVSSGTGRERVRRARRAAPRLGRRKRARVAVSKASKKSFIFRVIISTEPREYSRVLSWFAAVRRDRVRPAVRAARAENRERKRRRERRALFRRRRDGTRDERRVHAPGVFAD